MGVQPTHFGSSLQPFLFFPLAPLHIKAHAMITTRTSLFLSCILPSFLWANRSITFSHPSLPTCTSLLHLGQWAKRLCTLLDFYTHSQNLPLLYLFQISRTPLPAPLLSPPCTKQSCRVPPRPDKSCCVSSFLLWIDFTFHGWGAPCTRDPTLHPYRSPHQIPTLHSLFAHSSTCPC